MSQTIKSVLSTEDAKFFVNDDDDDDDDDVDDDDDDNNNNNNNNNKNTNNDNDNDNKICAIYWRWKNMKFKYF